MANPIYREVVPRALPSVTEMYLPVDERSFVLADGRLDFDRLLDEFVDFRREHAESFLKRQPYSEAAAQLVCMAYLRGTGPYGASGELKRDVAKRRPPPAT